MFLICLGVKLTLNTNLITSAIYNFAENISLNKKYLFNIISIISQMAFGAITYIVMLIILKDQYIYTFINKIKNKFLKEKEA